VRISAGPPLTSSQPKSVNVFNEDREYHRRRAEVELECAILAEAPECAIAHLKLARLHRARREMLAQQNLDMLRRNARAPILRADKEA
jgi:hypothetical protein